MTDITDEQRAFLDRFGFDRARFESWQADLRKGKRSKAGNRIDAKLTAPLPDLIHDLPKSDSPEYEELSRLGRNAIEKGALGLVVLNGGMATRFGGAVKGCVDVLPGKSFLALKLLDTRRTAEQCNGRIPIYLMNSFATDEKTAEHLTQNNRFGFTEADVRPFTQFVSMRMKPDGEVFRTEDGELSLHGPGHGDFAEAFARSGLLREFLDGGGKHLLVANVDNLGARVSPAVLGHHLHHKAEMTVEVAPKWAGDVGGAPLVVDGRIQIVEQLRYPEGFSPDVVDVFNTNTFHFDARSLDREEGFDLGYYYVEKKVDDQVVVQFERLIGEMTRWLNSEFVRVKRTGPTSRFLPIKTPEDLESARDEIKALYEGL